MVEDAELLRRYAENGSDASFAELVNRHLALVYFGALRRLDGDSHLAADVSQGVFISLERNARSLRRHPALSAWLFTTTRNAAINTRVAEQRRRRREQEAALMHESLADDNAPVALERLQPMLYEALDELPGADRDAVLLRFFERRPFAEIGRALRVTEEAARKRVDRAVQKLQDNFARRGVVSTATAMTAALTAEAASTPPVVLSGAIAAALATGGSKAVLASTGIGAAAGAGIFMSTKTTAIVGALAFAAIVMTFFEWNRVFRAESELAALLPERDSLRVQLHSEQQRAGRSAQEIASLRSELDVLKAAKAIQVTPKIAPSPALSAPVKNIGPSGKSMQIMANLVQISDSRDRFLLENGRPPTSLEELVGEGKLIKQLVPVEGEDYSGLSMTPGQTLEIKGSDGRGVNYTPTSEVVKLRRKISPARAQALTAYTAANNGQRPPSEEALISYFATPQEGADFVEFLEAQKAARGK